MSRFFQNQICCPPLSQDLASSKGVVFFDDAADEPHHLIAVDVRKPRLTASGDAAPDEVRAAPQADKAIERR